MAGVEVVDEMIGRKFGVGGHLEVTKRLPNISGKARVYEVFCEECAKDVELFGEALFSSSKTSLLKGFIPCGCSPSPRWTEAQWITRINRECKKRNYEFIGFATSGQSISRLKLTLKCLHDGNVWNTTTVDQFLRGCGCMECRGRDLALSNTISDEKMTNMVLATGAFPDNTKFWRSGRRNARGDLSYWAYKCIVCSDDEYVKAGICTGVFEGFSGTLLRGQKACRCSPNYHWTKEQREHQINKVISTEPKYKFKGWVNQYVNSESEIIIHCEDHGEHTLEVTKFIHVGTRCPKCASYGYKRDLKGYLYVLLVDGVVEGFTGYGISNIPKERLQSHKCALEKVGQSIVCQTLFEGNGDLIYDIEQELKQKFPLNRQETTGFRTEATFSKLYNGVVEYVERRLLCCN